MISAKVKRVYPRPRGEAFHRATRSSPRRGLSPPTRGSQAEHLYGGQRRGSIPAHAGKPSASARSFSASGVYPRPRGEAILERSRTAHPCGLSPPTRGSPDGIRAGGQRDRSIPAHAGKPSMRTLMAPPPTVYPRPRGEATAALMMAAWAAGLSPPTRGSHVHGPLDDKLDGSIPAHAGKPGAVEVGIHIQRVYPRPRGEALEGAKHLPFIDGLSPPTRGSRSAGILHLSFTRSIPAHAGKPSDCLDKLHMLGVYPRPRGEAKSWRTVPES